MLCLALSLFDIRRAQFQISKFNFWFLNLNFPIW